jgi:phage anti-repressor protein
MEKKHFITFGAGGQYYEAVDRLCRQIENTQLFHEIVKYSDKFLKESDEFWSKHSEFIEKNPRGYGYYLWKPYIIQKEMEKMKEGDILLYLDAGCEFNIHKKNRLKELFEIVKKDYIIGSPVLIEKRFCKMDLVLHLDMFDDIYMNTPQRQGGVNLFYVCDKTRALVNLWYEIACEYHFIDDSPSVSPNSDIFKEHRHDQSIFSLLTKKYNLFSEHSLSDCVEIIRNRTGVSRIESL